MRLEEYNGYGSTDIPKVGGKCTMHFYSDSEPCQVVRVSKSGKTMWIRENKTEHDKTKEGGMGHQNWLIHENEFVGDERKISLRRNGQWRESKTNTYVALGQWHKYYDWSF